MAFTDDHAWGEPSFTYTQPNGIEEDLLNVIINISPPETPLFSSLKKGKASQPKHEWLKDALAAPAANAQMEGADPTFDEAAARTRDYNYCQIFWQPVAVSGTMRASDTINVPDEMAYQLMKGLKEHARDIERALIQNTTRTVGTKDAARAMGGMTVFIDGYSSATTGWSGNTLGKNGAGGFSEDEFNDAIQYAWNDGGHVDTVMTGGTLKRRISKFTASSTKNVAAEDKRLVNAIDVYESDFGIVKIVANRWMSYSTSGDVFFLEMERWRVSFLRPTQRIPIAKTGDSDKMLVLTEMTLDGLAPEANAAIKAATSSTT